MPNRPHLPAGWEGESVSLVLKEQLQQEQRVQDGLVGTIPVLEGQEGVLQAGAVQPLLHPVLATGVEVVAGKTGKAGSEERRRV